MRCREVTRLADKRDLCPECVLLADGVSESGRLRAALARLVAVGGALSMNGAGPHWDELCAALSEARWVLRS